MKSVVVCSLALSLAAPVALGACSRDRGRTQDRERLSVFSEREIANPNDQDRSGVLTLTSASWVASEAAVDRIVASRCAREISCSNVGPNKLFASGDICAREVRSRMHDELQSMSCWAGVDSKELDECLDAIRKESCANPVDTVNRLAACRANELCLKSEMPHR